MDDITVDVKQVSIGKDNFESDSIEKATLPDIKMVTIPAGKYLVFSEQGAMPNAVITAWQNVWTYFTNDDCKHTRLYNIDFEHYISDSQIDVYIGVAYKS